MASSGNNQKSNNATSKNNKSLLGWNCSNCTFYHSVPGTRCAMCQELRAATRQEMHDFVLGKPVRQKYDGNVVELLNDTPPEKQQQRSAPRPSAASCSTSLPQPVNLQTKMARPHNPYRMATATATAAVVAHRTTHQTGLADGQQQRQAGAATTTTIPVASHSKLGIIAIPYTANKENHDPPHKCNPVRPPPSSMTIRNPYASRGKNSGPNTTTQIPHQPPIQKQQQPPQPQAPRLNPQWPQTRQPDTQWPAQGVAAQGQPAAGGGGGGAHVSASVPNQPLHSIFTAPKQGATPHRMASEPNAVGHQVPRIMADNGDKSSLQNHYSHHGTLQRRLQQSHWPNSSTNPNTPAGPMQPQGMVAQRQGVPRDDSAWLAHSNRSMVGTMNTPGYTETSNHDNSNYPRRNYNNSVPSLDNKGNNSSNNNKTNAAEKLMAAAVPRIRKFVPGPVPICPVAAGHWIYPQNDQFPTRQYQLEMTEKALFYNTLVSLPTGLGKTLIAAVVMYNFYRWFPDGKVIFMAPTLPLVTQQVKACYDIMGISEDDTAVLTGRIHVTKRKELWESRRLFYCTPQTVQKDLDTKTCPDASKVVCIVLDEAHKASGEYAYTKVIQKLDFACAKYRILGLSATPGTTIKAVQNVVNALRITKIEARTESHPSVQPYVHGRQSEIVLVEQCLIQNELEKDLIDIIKPVFDSLRNDGAMSPARFGGYKLTGFQIHKARETFLRGLGENADPSIKGRVLGTFHAAYTLANIREKLHQSVGVVRTLLGRLRNCPNRGILSTIVKGEAFQRLLDKTNPGQEGNIEQQSSPKLIKLADILNEHFERARACGKSSRAIVFAQFRDSVSEIVQVLTRSEPMIRPRHFVGQGKAAASSNKNQKSGAKGKNNNTNDEAEDTNTTVPLNGMKQREQQQAIREFQDNVFNVLVCTCIGEEGLDIGEVDLIVNYDCLRSPIRMIQRTGRTGRKRDGRVVCLVAEGQEQRTHDSSKQAEKTLHRALKDSSKFTLSVNEPMFETPPERQNQLMSIGTQFHLSQVGGHVKQRDPAGELSRSKRAAEWKLTASQEKIRRRILGSIEEVMIPRGDMAGSSSTGLPGSLHRLLLRGRSLSKSRSIPAPNRRTPGGRTVNILRRLETLSNETATPVLKSKRTRTRKSFSGRQDVFHQLFPLEPVESMDDFAKELGGDDDEQASDVYRPFPPVGNSALHRPIQALQAPVQVAQSEATAFHTVVVPPLTTERQGESDTGVVDESSEKPHRIDTSWKPHPLHPARQIDIRHTAAEPPRPPVPHSLPNANQNSGRSAPPLDIDFASRDTAHQYPEMAQQEPSGRMQPNCIGSVQPVASGSHDAPSSHSEDLVPHNVASENRRHTVTEVVVDQLPDVPVFRLPTPPPSSSSSSSSEDEDDQSDDECFTNSVPKTVGLADHGLAQPQNEVGPTTPNVAAQTGAGHADPLEADSNMPGKGGSPRRNETEVVACHIEAESPFIFRLPTPTSSSDEGSVSTEISAAPGVGEDNTGARLPSKGGNETSDEEEDTPLVSLGRQKQEGKYISKTLGQQSSTLEKVLSNNENAVDEDQAIGERSSIEQDTGSHKPKWSAPDCKRAFIPYPSSEPEGLPILSGHGRRRIAASPETPDHGNCMDYTRMAVVDKLESAGEAKAAVARSTDPNASQEASPEVLATRPNRKRRNHAILDDESSSGSSPEKYINSKRQSTSDMPHPGDRKELGLTDTPATRTTCPNTPSALNNAMGAFGVFYKESPEPFVGTNKVVPKHQVVEGTPFPGHHNELEATPGDASQEVVVVRHSHKRRDFVILDDESSGHIANQDNYTMKTPKPGHSNELMDTPDEHERDADKACVGNDEASVFHDTPSTHQFCVESSTDEIVCSICFSDESPDDNPIVLCDGSCNLGFHQTCYSFNVDLESDGIWRCDLCEIKHNRSLIGCLKSQSEDQCMYCLKGDGALKRQGGGWYHPYCEHFYFAVVDEEVICGACSAKGAVQCLGCTSAAHAHCAIHDKTLGNWTLISIGGISGEEQRECAMFCPKHLERGNHFLSPHVDKKGRDGSTPKIFLLNNKGASSRSNGPGEYKRLKKKSKPERDPGKSSQAPSLNVSGRPPCSQQAAAVSNICQEDAQQKRQRLDRRRAVMSRFIDSEARINSDDDMNGDDDEDDEIRRLEEDEQSNSSFINDSLNLTQCFTQDELAQVDPDAGPHQGGDDVHRALDAERDREMLFKTPVLNRRGQETTPDSAPSSQKGLGNMHFIRSVLEHHRNGGEAEEIEVFYHQVERGSGGSNNNINDTPCETPAARPPPIHPSIPTQDYPARNESSRGQTSLAAAQTLLGGTSAPPGGRFVASKPQVSGLTAEQRARIERNRLAALERLKQQRR